MTENADRAGGGGASRSEGSDLLDDAVRLVDDLQRKLFAAGVRRGVGAMTQPPQGKGDVWEEAIRLESDDQRPPLEEFLDIVRTSGPEVAAHLGRAGLAVAGALGRTWGVVERSLEQGRDHGDQGRNPGGDGGRDGGGVQDGGRRVTAEG